jgi:hypothetical protein
LQARQTLQEKEGAAPEGRRGPGLFQEFSSVCA